MRHNIFCIFMFLEKFSRLQKNDRLFRSLTGLTIDKFNSLVGKFSEEYQTFQKNRLKKSPFGRPPILENPAEKLFYILFYMKVYPTFDLAGFLFGVDRSSACRWSHQFMSVLENTLEKKMLLPKRKITSMKELLRLIPVLKTILIDVVERPIRRPVNNETQKLHYSGKKKRHTVKNTVLTTKRKKIVYLSGTSPGTEHDYSMFKDEKLGNIIPDEFTTLVDKGYQGIEGDFPDLKVKIPKKKPKGKELSLTDKKRNKAISKKRIYVEHAIGGIKRLGITSNIFRNIKKDFDDKAMVVAAGVWNLYLG